MESMSVNKSVLFVFFVFWGTWAGLSWYTIFVSFGFFSWVAAGALLLLGLAYGCRNSEQRSIMRLFWLNDRMVSALGLIVICDAFIVLDTRFPLGSPTWLTEPWQRYTLIVGVVIIVIAAVSAMRKIRGEPIRGPVKRLDTKDEEPTD
jgi:hypothetical protein